MKEVSIVGLDLAKRSFKSMELNRTGFAGGSNS